MASCTFSIVNTGVEVHTKAEARPQKRTAASFRCCSRAERAVSTVKMSASSATGGTNLSARLTGIQPSRHVRRTDLFICFAEAEGKAEETDAEEPAEAEEAATEEAEDESSEEEEEEENPLLSEVKAMDEDLGAQVEEMAAGLVARAEKAEAEATKVKDSYLRLNADFENFRKRTLAEKTSLKAEAQSGLIEELLPVIDNFELAKQSLKLETEGEEKVDASYQNLYRQMVDTFKKIGLNAVPTVGAEFDPMVHEAIMREPTADFADGVVMQEFRRGFMFGERLLRPAMVKVAMAPPEAAEASSEAGEEGAAEGAADGEAPAAEAAEKAEA